MRVALLLFMSFFAKVTFAQQIESIVGVTHADAGPTIQAVGDAGDAAEIIMSWLGSYAMIACNDKMRPSLKQNLTAALKKYKDTIPVGAAAEFIVLTNKYKCEVIGMVVKTQTVRIKNGQCNIKDLELTEPPIIYDPSTTGFFTITVKF